MDTYFKFEIKQTVDVLLYKIKNGNGKKWNVEDDAKAGMLILRETGNPDNRTEIILRDGTMQITTVHNHHYTIFNKKGDGAIVGFHGPVNALLMQSLLPRMTYVPGTLLATNDSFDGYVPIAEFMEARAKKHGDKVNPQDKFGWRINQAFNNELAPWLPSYRGYDRQEHIGSKKSRKNAAGKFSRK